MSHIDSPKCGAPAAPNLWGQVAPTAPPPIPASLNTSLRKPLNRFYNLPIAFAVYSAPYEPKQPCFQHIRKEPHRCNPPQLSTISHTPDLHKSPLCPFTASSMAPSAPPSSPHHPEAPLPPPSSPSQSPGPALLFVIESTSCCDRPCLVTMWRRMFRIPESC